jgi:hypothetical protein
MDTKRFFQGQESMEKVTPIKVGDLVWTMIPYDFDFSKVRFDLTAVPCVVLDIDERKYTPWKVLYSKPNKNIELAETVETWVGSVWHNAERAQQHSKYLK